MNSKLLFLTLIILCSACGVKGDPKAPESARLPSILEDYSDVKTDKKLEETKQP